jgi:hypothetical protein
VPQDRSGFELEIFSKTFQIFDLGTYRDIFRVHIPRRPATSSLVIIDQAEGIGQAIRIGEKVGVIEIGSAMQNDERLSLSDFAVIQLGTPDREEAFTRDRRV